MKKRNVIALAGVALLSAGILAACSGGSKSSSSSSNSSESGKNSPMSMRLNLKT